MKISAFILGILFVCLGTVVSCGKQQNDTVYNRKLSHDFIFSAISNKTFKNISAPDENQSCLEHIKSITCFSDQEEGGFDSNCNFKELEPNIVSKFDELIKELPPFHEKVFCHINRLQIHTKVTSSIAYAAIMQNNVTYAIGNMIGIRLDAIKSKTNHDLFSWKEQLNFGFSKQKDLNYTISPTGPQVLLKIEKVRDPQFFYILVHELGHLIDFMNDTNKEKCERSSDEGATRVICRLTDYSFGKSSWPNYVFSGSKWPTNEFKTLHPLLSKMCFYSCTDYVSLDLVNDIYSDLSTSAFITSYAASNYMEDFAESSVASTLITEDYGFQYKVINSNKDILFDMREHWQSDFLKAKREWMQNFFSKTNLNYQRKLNKKK